MERKQIANYMDVLSVHIGGGDTVSAIESSGTLDGFTHISSGGGAFLAALEGDYLPGIKPLLVE